MTRWCGSRARLRDEGARSGKVVASKGGVSRFGARQAPKTWRHNMALAPAPETQDYAMGRERSVTTAEEPN